jgi:iron complex transport system ATP-binding protein
MMLEFQNVSFNFGAKSVLRDLSFQIAKGEVVALLGENGAGKTSILRMIIGLIKSNSGVIRLVGEDLSKISQRKIGSLLSYVPQSIQIAFDLQAQQFFSNPEDPHTECLIADLKISAFLNRSFLSLSGGERQRVLLASALAQQPSLLILDELTQYADSSTTDFLGEFLASYRTHFGLTILAVSHDSDWTQKYTERALLLKDGQIQLDNLPHKLKACSVNSEKVHAAS